MYEKASIILQLGGLPPEKKSEKKMVEGPGEKKKKGSHKKSESPQTPRGLKKQKS